MNLLSIRALRGPNLWHHEPCIVLQLDLGEMEARPSDQLPGFRERLEQAMPSLYTHHCSEDRPGGFLDRVSQGTWMGHIVEHVALELQSLAGMEVTYGRTRGIPGRPGVYHVVFRYIEENAGLLAGREAVRFVEAMIVDEAYDVAATVQALREARERERLGPSTGSLVEEAARRGIPWLRLNNRSLVQLGHGAVQQRIQATVTGRTGMISTEIASDKAATKALLDRAGVPVPTGEEVQSLAGALDAAHTLGWPVVCKPLDGNHGRGATVNIRDDEALTAAFHAAKVHSRYVIIERFITGADFRMLVINHELVAAAERVPAHVVGDGQQTIQQLIDEANKDPRRGFGHENLLTYITVDEMTERLLDKDGRTLSDVPAVGERVMLKTTANLSTGGTSIDVTDRVHPANILMAERISRIIGLDICGIDVLASTLDTPVKDNGGAVIEVNAAPGFRMHLAPSEGIARNVAEPVIDMLFPGGADGRIPIFAVTGTNGKTTTTRLLAHILTSVGQKVGFTTTEGIYIQGQRIIAGDTTGPDSAQTVLRDPTVTTAVLECARGGLLRRGLGFRESDIGIVLNVTEDHLGLEGIDSLDDLARVKRIVAETVREDGWAVLNADDPHVYRMRNFTPGKVVYFTMDEHNPNIARQKARGRISCVYENGYITILKGEWKIRIVEAVEVPLTLDGHATFMIQNVLAATAAAFVHGLKPGFIRAALTSFVPSFGTTPGRLNRMTIRGVDVLLDFAHNPSGVEAIGKLVERMPGQRKIGTISCAGDRRDVDMQEMARLAARVFTDIVVRESPKYRRGRPAGEITERMHQYTLDAGFPADRLQRAADERAAIRQVLEMSQPGDLVVVLADEIELAHDEILAYKKQVEPLVVGPTDIPNRTHYAPDESAQPIHEP